MHKRASGDSITWRSMKLKIMFQNC